MTISWRTGLLKAEHDLTHFDCGVASLNDWLATQAMRAQSAGTARTYVWTAPESTRVVAYYSITPSRVLRDEVGRGDSGGYSQVPVYLLARLALDQELHGQRFGTDLLLDAVEVLVAASERAGGRLIVVDAVDERAARFYQHHDFRPVRSDPLRLVMKMSTAVAILTTAKIEVTADAALRLGSLDVYRPDGTTSAVILTPEELGTLGDRLAAAAEGGQAVDVRSVIFEVTGRDIATD